MLGAYTSLGLGGLLRSGDLYDSDIQAPARPDDIQYTELGLGAIARAVQNFDPKSPGSIPPRPDDIQYTELGLGAMPRAVQLMEAHGSVTGIAGVVNLSVQMSGAITIGRRYYTTTNVVTSVRTIGSVITVAHRNFASGNIALSVRAQASQLRYTRFGASNTIQGASSVVLTPFGNLIYRPARRVQGDVPLQVRMSAALAYTPAPQRNYSFTGRPRLSIRPQSAMAFAAGGVDYSITGTNTISVTMRGAITIVQQTTYYTAGQVTMSVRMAGTVTHTTGAPRNYTIAADIRFAVNATATFMGLVTGANEQHHIDGLSRVSLTPQSKITVKRATVIQPLPGRRGKRRLIRLFRK